MKVAIYSRGKQLAIREQPSSGAPIIGAMGSGFAAHVEEAAPGWLELAMGGYIRKDLVTVVPLVDESTYTIKEQPQEAPEEQPQPEQETEEQADDGDDSALKAMKLNELRELAKGSGIALPKNATKAQIIGLLTGSDEQA